MTSSLPPLLPSWPPSSSAELSPSSLRPLVRPLEWRPLAAGATLRALGSPWCPKDSPAPLERAAATDAATAWAAAAAAAAGLKNDPAAGAGGGGGGGCARARARASASASAAAAAAILGGLDLMAAAMVSALEWLPPGTDPPLSPSSSGGLPEAPLAPCPPSYPPDAVRPSLLLPPPAPSPPSLPAPLTSSSQSPPLPLDAPLSDAASLSAESRSD
mmetsp:Transcript_19291/g.58266  ORF Transcript_19291/g.58266 Transcript_19291/m.58266 type:complete len:216 (-) Transcript_19291:118-765(-)